MFVKETLSKYKVPPESCEAVIAKVTENNADPVGIVKGPNVNSVQDDDASTVILAIALPCV